MTAESPAGKAGRTGSHSGHRKLQSEHRPASPVPLCLQGDKLLTEKLSLWTMCGLRWFVVRGP